MKGDFDTETGNLLLAALSPLTKPFGADDTRTPAQRRADALAEILRRYLDSGASPPTAATAPTCTCTSTPATCATNRKPPAPPTATTPTPATPNATIRRCRNLPQPSRTRRRHRNPP